jgi:ankyrin repeat protein
MIFQGYDPMISTIIWLLGVAISNLDNSQVALLGRETCTPQTRSAATLPGSTPLLAAAGIGSEELVELLMSYGAYPQVNDRGESCEFLAEANGHYNVLPCFQTVAV